MLGLSGAPVPQSQAQYQSTAKSITDLFAVSNSGPSSQVSSPPPFVTQAPPQPARTPDPFASLNTPTPRHASPMHFQQSTGSGAIDLLGGSSPAPAPAPAPSSSLAQSSSLVDANDDDEWTFSSAVPDTSKELTVVNSSLNIVFNVSRESDSTLLVKSRISNNTSSPVSGLTFQVAASKVRRHSSSSYPVLSNAIIGRATAIGTSDWCLTRS